MAKLSVSSRELVRLAPWEELVGKLCHLEEDGDWLTVTLSTGRLRFDVQSAEADYARERLAEENGNMVSILRIDSSTDPIRVEVREDSDRPAGTD